VLIGAEDLTEESKMSAHRLSLDGGAKANYPRSKFLLEEILPYIRRMRKDGIVVNQPATPETKKYRVLKRYYE
jgi:hypothetical protein